MRDKSPMTEDKAKEILAEMRKAGTKPSAERRLLQLALGPLGNLSSGARKVYEDRLAECAC